MKTMFDIDITDEGLDLAVLRRAAREPLRVRLTDAVRGKVAKAAEAVSSIIDSGRVTYGINTGFGLLAQRTIPRGELEHLQRNLVLSHAAGVGAPLPDAVVRLVMLLKIVGLTRGYSGTRVEIVEALAAL
ncbi:MAG: aromatic amino acid lyase, partial [Alphaproteobacteria bacterium]|nr:aromatic amino acid lyase [Alphaproteobacteria bacterium]